MLTGYGKKVRELLNKAAWDKTNWLSSFEKLPWQTLLASSPKWLSLLLVLLIAQAAAEMTWVIFTPEEIQQTRTQSRSTVVSPSSQVRLNSVVKLHIFGEAQEIQAEVVNTEAPIDAPKTNLKLVLRGVFTHSDPDKAMVIIADAAGKEKLYRTGGKVPGGATVHTIYSDRVILQRNGQFETLNLPRDKLPSRAVAVSRSVSRDVKRERSVQAPNKLKEMRKLIKTNPQEIWKQVRIEPVLENGKIKGYRLFHQDAQLMRALGITKTDVITEVNGMSLDDPSALYELMGQFDTASDIRLTVERNGATEVLVVHM